MATSMKNSHLGKASGVYEDIIEVCEPCSVADKHLKADRFCVDCQEYLCKTCATYHTTQKGNKKHVLITTDDANNAKPATFKDKCSYKCSEHKDKSVKYMCASHSYLGCSVCMIMDHKQCQRMDYIPKVAADIRNLDAFKKFTEKLNSIETACKARITDLENNLKQISADGIQMREAVKEFRKKMNTALDKFEHELTTQSNKINLEETNKLNALSKKLSTSLSAVDALINQVDNFLSSGKNCDTYVLIRKEASHLVALNDEIVNTTNGTTYQRYEFEPNNDIFKAGFMGKLSILTEDVSRISVKKLSSPSTDVPAKKAVDVSSPGTDVTSRSKQIQPGTRVLYIGYRWMRGTVERYDSSRGKWLVRWDHGVTDYRTTDELKILEEQ